MVGTGAGSAPEQGYSVSLSGDGNTLASGGQQDGSTWVFTRSAGNWTQQGSKLRGTGFVGTHRQGYSVSLSDDGDTLAVGGREDNGDAGATWIFTWSAGNWTQQGSKLFGTGYAGSSSGQGGSVSLSADGNTLAVGGRDDNSGIGATWMFTRSAGNWTQQGSKLFGTGYVGEPRQGRSVSLSSVGDRLAVGGRSDNSNTGATWLFDCERTAAPT